MPSMTRWGVYHDLNDSTFRHTTIHNLEYVFSSELNMEKFIARCSDKRDEIRTSLENRFDLNIDASLIADLKLYEDIESRGYLIIDKGSGLKCTSKNQIFVGLNKTTMNLSD